MITRNMGPLDRALRFIASVALIPVGLLALGGWQGNAIGLAVVVVALGLLMTSLTGFCPGYVPFGVSTLQRGSGHKNATDTLRHPRPTPRRVS